MKQNEIQYLIDLYLNGETSPEQERQLAIALEQDDIPEDWQAVRLMLGELTLGEAIYDEVLAKRYRRPLWFWRWAAAAVVILAAGLGFIFHQRESTPQPVMLAESPVCRPLSNWHVRVLRVKTPLISSNWPCRNNTQLVFI